MADSIDQMEHVIWDDTAAIGGVIRQLDNPLGRLFMRSTLGKAYYYMGRNLEDCYQQIAEAAECYIEADRLQIDDPIYRGRVNSCMAHICKQNGNDNLALLFFEQANKDFKESTNYWYYAQTLLDVCEFNIKLQKFPIADSLLQIASSYNLDSLYKARYYETEGLYFFEQQQYDSALVYFHRGLNLWQTENDRCFSYMKIMQIYSQNNMLLSALLYADKLIKYSIRPGFLVNAYYCIMQYAASKEDLVTLEQSAHKRADYTRDLTNNAIIYAEAVALIQNYLQNPYPWRWGWITLVSFSVLSLILIIGMIIFRRSTTMKLRVSDTQIVNLSTKLQEQENDFHDHMNYDKHLAKIFAKYPTPLNRWNQYSLLREDIDPYLHDWLIALDELELTNREKVFCAYIFIYPHLPVSKVADYMNNTERAVRVLKTRIARKLNITSSQLPDFLKKKFYQAEV